MFTMLKKRRQPLRVNIYLAFDHDGYCNVTHMLCWKLGAGTDASMVSALKAEINRLQERLIAVETENLYLNKKVTQQRWDMDHRLAEIEMQICKDVGSSADSSCDDNERNKESII